MFGSMEKRGKIFGYYDMMSDPEKDEDGNMATDDDEALEYDMGPNS